MDNFSLQELRSQTSKKEIARIKKGCDYSARYGLALSDAEIANLIELRECDLVDNERVEWDGGILDKLIYAFADSIHISKDNYTDTLQALQSMFYEFKNESLDLIDDDDLISEMRKAYDRSEGSLDYVAETAMTEKCRELRFEDCIDEDDIYYDEDENKDGDDIL